MAIEIAMTRTLYCTVGDKFIDKYQFYVNMFRLVLISMNKLLIKKTLIVLISKQL